METVSYPLAQQLKKAGFPQPEPVRGQTWHTNPIQPVKVGGSTGQAGEVWITTSSSNWPVKKEILQAACAYAPTHEELQQEIKALSIPTNSQVVGSSASADELAEIWMEMKEQGERSRQRYLSV